MQGGSSGIGYGLKYQVLSQSRSLFNLQLLMGSVVVVFFWQARCISDVKADTDHTSFLTGTLSLKEENEVMDLLDCICLVIRICLVYLIV